jgi:apolipoprotein N-acyltransferase
MPPAQSRWYVTLGCGLAGAVLLWAAFPPLDWPLLAWVAPLPWLWLARLPALPGWRPYLVLWLAGSLHWLLMLQGIRLAHPALYGGWLALSIYLGIYLPLFVGLTRVAVQRLKVSLVIAAPVVWVGLELLRGHLVTGFSNGLLAHTQAEIPLLIQVSDLAGGYTLSFVIMLVAACLTRLIPLWGGCDSRCEPQPGAAICWWPLLPITAAIAATLLYGNWRLSQPHAAGPKARVALIQGSLDTVFGEERLAETLDHYRTLSDRAIAEQPNLDLVIWPESSFLARETLIEEPLAPLPNVPISVEQLRTNLEDAQGEFQHLLAGEAARASARTSTGPGTKLLVGTTSFVYGPSPPRMYNSALVSDREGKIECRYYKTHPVMFGEYIPFGEWLPWLYRITPIGMGLSRGDGPRVFEAAGVTFAPNICFESTIPHLVRRQLAELRRRGTPADVIVNVSNDGWFWGSSILDLHFRSNILRAVENRRPLVVAANTGISAWIDGNGVVQEQAQRRTSDVLLAAVQAEGRGSPYHTLGDWPAWLCAAACVGLALLGCRRAESGRSRLGTAE